MKGMKLPRVTFKVRQGDVAPDGPGCPIGGTWKDVFTDDYFKGKRRSGSYPTIRARANEY